MSQDFKTWSEVSKAFPEGAVAAIEAGGLRFFDEHNVGPRTDHYLMLEGLSWAVVNSLRSAGFEVVRAV